MMEHWKTFEAAPGPRVQREVDTLQILASVGIFITFSSLFRSTWFCIDVFILFLHA